MKTIWNFLAGALCGAIALFVFLRQMPPPAPPAAPVSIALAALPPVPIPATELTAADLTLNTPAPQFAPLAPLAAPAPAAPTRRLGP